MCEDEEACSEVTHLAIRRQVADTKVVTSFIRKRARSLAVESADLSGDENKSTPSPATSFHLQPVNSGLRVGRHGQNLKKTHTWWWRWLSAGCEPWRQLSLATDPLADRMTIFVMPISCSAMVTRSKINIKCLWYFVTVLPNLATRCLRLDSRHWTRWRFISYFWRSLKSPQ